MDNSLWQGPQIEQQRNLNQNHPLISKLLDFARKYIKKREKGMNKFTIHNARQRTGSFQ